MIFWLPRVVPGRDAEGRNADHPIRAVARAAALEPGGWDAEVAARVRAAFDELAPGWNERFGGAAEHEAPLGDALQRGKVQAEGRALELGSGTGLATMMCAAHFGALVAADLSFEMLRRAPGAFAPRVQADAARLPFPDRAFDAVVLVNALLFGIEIDRVLGAAGAIVWVNTLGADTPIYLPAEDVVAALPGDWEAVAAHAGAGSWVVCRRAGHPSGTSDR